jgi:hypothetical protein
MSTLKKHDVFPLKWTLMDSIKKIRTLIQASSNYWNGSDIGTLDMIWKLIQEGLGS